MSRDLNVFYIIYYVEKKPAMSLKENITHYIILKKNAVVKCFVGWFILVRPLIREAAPPRKL